MRKIKHFAGYGSVEAGIEKRFRHDKHDAILIRVVGNHERGLVPGGMMCGYEANRYCDSLVRQGYTKAWGCGDLRYWLLDRLTRKYKDVPDKYVSAYYKCDTQSTRSRIST